MKLILTFVILLLLTSLGLCNITADLMFDPNSGGSGYGLLTTNVATNMIFTTLPNTYVAYYGTNANGNWQRTWIVPAGESDSYKVPVTVGSVTYTIASSNWLSYVSGTNLYGEQLRIGLQGYITSAQNVMVCGWVNIGITNLSGNEYQTDEMWLWGSGNTTAYESLHFYPNETACTFVAHAADCSSASTFGPERNFTLNKTYFRVAYRDILHGTNWLKYYDPLTWNIVGVSSTNMCSTGDNSWLLQWNAGYIYNIGGTMYEGQQYVKLNATMADFNALDNAPYTGPWVIVNPNK